MWGQRQKATTKIARKGESGRRMFNRRKENGDEMRANSMGSHCGTHGAQFLKHGPASLHPFVSSPSMFRLHRNHYKMHVHAFGCCNPHYRTISAYSTYSIPAYVLSKLSKLQSGPAICAARVKMRSSPLSVVERCWIGPSVVTINLSILQI
ncbi:hypothetical protein GMOD_00005803 [Pyrenophora seminiperda CCB06]|uniref:Uncharacterized protein n=1 Tax=Pyrenophora seminiperda CCB06 TaxID=1302712 RepID=A0A3M7MA71_9PLEO|nr:hypothetical protein GMOD_00005803 [Pyrenophora seminiperda CCB06]